MSEIFTGETAVVLNGEKWKKREDFLSVQITPLSWVKVQSTSCYSHQKNYAWDSPLSRSLLSLKVKINATFLVVYVKIFNEMA